MTSSTKASSAGSTSGGGASLGSIRRGASATRASSLDIDGSGAPSHRPARPARLIIALALATAALLALTATPALALTTHLFSTSFGTSGPGDGQLSSPQGVAVNDTSHDVYVADTGNARVDQFSSAGAFIRAWGWGVADGTTAALQTCTSGCHAGLPGSGPGAFTAPTFIAVDNSAGGSGDVYVGDIGTNLVQKFDSSGSYLSTNDGSTATTPIAGPFGSLAGITVDTAGNLWVYDQSSNMFEFAQNGSFTTDWNSGFGVTPAGIAVDSAGNLYIVRGVPVVQKLDPSGNSIGEITGAGFTQPTTGLAIDPSTNDLYVDGNGSAIYHYDPSCDPSAGDCAVADSFGSGHLSAAAGLAVDPSSGTIFAADAGNQRISVFTGPVIIPDATTNPATSIDHHSATMNGHLDPAAGGGVSDCHFQYTDDATFTSQGYTGASTIACDQSTPIFSPADVTATPTGLDQGTTYHFRLVATDAQGTAQGHDQIFTTLAAVELSTGSASLVARTSATLNGTLNPGGVPLSSCQFDYGTDTFYGTTVPCDQSLASIGSGTSDVPVSADVSGLQAGTPYHFRLEATNALGTSLGQDSAFHTRTESTTFGSSGSAGGQLSLSPPSPVSAGSGVAVDNSTGDLYVADTGNQRVDKFDSAGNFILAFGRNVDQTTGANVCTAASGDTCQAGTPGDGGGALSDPQYIAVDNSGGPHAGDVFVSSQGTSGNPSFISRFDSSGAYAPRSDNDGSAAGIGPFDQQTGVQGLAIDPSGVLWVRDSAGLVSQWAPGGGLVGNDLFLARFLDQTSGGQPGDLAVDNKHVFLATGNIRIGVQRFTTSGTPQGWVTRRDFHARRLALDPSTGDLFAGTDTVINHYNSSCTPVQDIGDIAVKGCTPSDVFGSGDLTDAAGLALDTSTSVLYVADAGTDQIAVFTPPPPGPPVITSQWASFVGAATATVNATVNPLSNDTTCQLAYTDDATFQSQGYTGATTVPCDPADVGSRFADQPVAANLSGLAPGTTYHYRFLASNTAGDDTGTDRTFATEIPEPALPDGRAYEQVTPPDKGGYGPETNSSGFIAADDGSRMSSFTFNAFPGSPADGHSYLSTRGAGGWSTLNLTPPQSQPTSDESTFCSAGFPAFSADLSRGILADGFNQTGGCGKDDPELVSGEPAGFQNVFLRNNDAGTYQLVSLNPVTGTPAEAIFDASSPDLSHVVFHEAAQLTPDAPAGADNLYEWSGGTVSLVSIDQGGTPIPGGATIAGDKLGNAAHAVSDDGSRVFFQGADGNLYARVDGTSTVQLDASQGPGFGGGGTFQWASADGSKVFFTDDASAGLTNDTVDGSGANLYRYDLSTGELTDLTPAADVQVQGLSGAGDSGSDVYFVANGVLAPGASPGDCQGFGGGEGGKCNLYVSHEGALTFIATLDSEFPGQCTWRADCLSARVSADGSHIAFDSDFNLTSTDTAGFTEVYLYDRSSDHLLCASCSPAGKAPAGDSALAPPSGGPVGLSDTSNTNPETLPRSLSADGSRLFFTSADALSSRDTNSALCTKPVGAQGGSNCDDVYEYQGGKLHLISTGSATTPAKFLDASSSGADVFFATAQRLVGSDTDSSKDIYDARVGGGFPEPPSANPCTGEACKPPASAPPTDQTPGSSSFSGPGNQGKNLGGSSKKKKCKKHKGKKCKKTRHANTNRGGSK